VPRKRQLAWGILVSLRLTVNKMANGTAEVGERAGWHAADAGRC